MGGHGSLTDPHHGLLFGRVLLELLQPTPAEIYPMPCLLLSLDLRSALACRVTVLSA